MSEKIVSKKSIFAIHDIKKSNSNENILAPQACIRYTLIATLHMRGDIPDLKTRRLLTIVNRSSMQSKENPPLFACATLCSVLKACDLRRSIRKSLNRNIPSIAPEFKDKEVEAHFLTGTYQHLAMRNVHFCVQNLLFLNFFVFEFRCNTRNVSVQRLPDGSPQITSFQNRAESCASE